MSRRKTPPKLPDFPFAKKGKLYPFTTVLGTGLISSVVSLLLGLVLGVMLVSKGKSSDSSYESRENESPLAKVAREIEQERENEARRNGTLDEYRKTKERERKYREEAERIVRESEKRRGRRY